MLFQPLPFSNLYELKFFLSLFFVRCAQFSLLNCDKRVVWLGVQPHSNQLLMAAEGRIEQICEDGQVHHVAHLPAADKYDVKFAQVSAVDWFRALVV